MMFRIQRAIHQTRFDFYCRDILNTAPVKVAAGGLAVVSMVSRRDVLMYLAAIKSFLLELGEGHPIILNDGSLQTSQIQLLEAHLPAASFVRVPDVDTGGGPQGGCWERLFTIIDLINDRYVVQLDSDTLTYGSIAEVKECYRDNASFTLGTSAGRSFVSLTESARMAQQLTSRHVQVIAERAFDSLPDGGDKCYVRGSAGFAGFARACFQRLKLEEFSAQMEKLTGPRWREWGSEQVASNYVVANSPSARVLPYPKYACFDPRINPTDSAFLHFVGPHRYARGVYRRMVQEHIAARRESAFETGGGIDAAKPNSLRRISDAK
jgi:hypothetical protein